jgi:glycerol kinase
MANVPEAAVLERSGRLCCGTIDSWLVFKLTGGKAFKTDYSNASRTQLFNIHTLKWDESLCALFGVSPQSLPEVSMSDSLFGYTNLGGLFPKSIPIRGVLGDSHAALLGQGCRERGNAKATYGTGSSVMTLTGETPSDGGGSLVTSLAWGLSGKVEYVLEGNINYTGAAITWLKNNLGLIASDAESEGLALNAQPGDKTCFVPAFSGLGAPYWDSGATALLTGMTRTTGRAEIVRACLDSIAFQISDIVRSTRKQTGLPISFLRVDGGPTANQYLMQRQSDIAAAEILVPNQRELSGMGAAYAAGFSAGLYTPETALHHVRYKPYSPRITNEERDTLLSRWRGAVKQALTHS